MLFFLQFKCFFLKSSSNMEVPKRAKIIKFFKLFISFNWKITRGKKHLLPPAAWTLFFPLSAKAMWFCYCLGNEAVTHEWRRCFARPHLPCYLESYITTHCLMALCLLSFCWQAPLGWTELSWYRHHHDVAWYYLRWWRDKPSHANKNAISIALFILMSRPHMHKSRKTRWWC